MLKYKRSVQHQGVWLVIFCQLCHDYADYQLILRQKQGQSKLLESWYLVSSFSEIFYIIQQNSVLFVESLQSKI